MAHSSNFFMRCLLIYVKKLNLTEPKHYMKKHLCTLFLGLGYLCLAQTDYSFVYDSDRIILEGNDLHNSQKYEEAIVKYDQISHIDPLYKNALYEKAMTFAFMKQEDKAREIYEKAYSDGLMANDADFLMAYGTFLSDRKEFDKAEQLYKQSETLTPNSPSLLYNMALLYVRREERQKSVDLLKKSVTLNPNHPGSHYLLGILAFEDGRITEGSLALMSYLAIAPEGAGAEQAILKLNAKFGENYLAKSNLVFSEKGDDFSEIEEILRNQLPLRNGYKVKSEIDDVITRQMQAIVEYLPEHKTGDGFFETIYGPWLKELARANQFESYSYYMLQGMAQRLGKAITGQKKKITAFKTEFIDTSFWASFAKRHLDIFGEKKDVVVYLKDGKSSFFAAAPNGKTQGKAKLVYPSGNLFGELQFVDDQFEGVQKYYDENGKLYDEKSYSKGLLNGTRTVYYPNGNLKIVENYKNGKLHGLSNSYYVNGGKACEVNFVDDERDGKMTCLYENGATKNEMTYAMGKLEGTVKDYNSLSEVTAAYQYKNGELTGDYTAYYDGKAIKTQADYSGGKIQSRYKAFYADGSLEEEYIYLNGNVKSGVHFLENSDKSYETLYDENNEIAQYTYFGDDGKKYYEELFKDGQLKTGHQYFSGKAEPFKTDIVRKGLEQKNLEGLTLVSGKYEKGRKMGDWRYYFTNGNLRETESFQNGRRIGLDHQYQRNGLIRSISNYVNDSLSGVYESYRNGVLSQIDHYNKNERVGPSTVYNADRSVSSVSFYDEGDLTKFIQYWQNGRPETVISYENETAVLMESYDINGKKENSFSYTGKTGKTTLPFYGGKILHEFHLVNGVFQGKYVISEKSGKPFIEAEYTNGDKHNHYKKYGPTGGLYVDINYHEGRQHGINRYYDLTGKLRTEIEFVFGEETGKIAYYFQNGQLRSVSKQFGGNFEGETNYYNFKGEPILILGYDYGVVKYYVSLDENGKLTRKTPVVGESASIVSSYPNGKTAIEMTFKKGQLEGKFGIYGADGKPQYHVMFQNGYVNGTRTEYYADGKLYKNENFINGRDEGLSEYFKEDGKPWLTANSKNDELHGECKVYGNGTVTTKIYDSDILLETR